MRQAWGYMVLAVLMLSALSIACESSSEAVSDSGIYEFFLREIASNDWQEVDPQRVDSGGETSNEEEWVVFYRNGDPSENPIDAVVYRLILDRYSDVLSRTPSFVAYDLQMPCDEHMCQHECKAERTDLLLAYEGPELIIRDEYEGDWVRLRAYRWVIETMKYELVAYFDGDSIDMGEGWVVIDNDIPGGADLISRCTYCPREGVQPFTAAEKMSYSECEITFPDDVPDGVLTSPYPEVVMMALYSQIRYTDTVKMQPYFTEGVRESIGGWGVERLGCPRTSTPIDSVRVTSMEISETRHITNSVRQDCPSDLSAMAEGLAIVVVEVCCEYMGGSNCEPGADPNPVHIMWMLAWEEDGWRLLGPPTPVEE